MISSLSHLRKYPHRTNPNGTIDSVCPDCLITIATSTWEAELEYAEASHICENERLAYFERQRSIPFRTNQFV